MSAIVMPIYQYQCTDCGHQLEALQKMSDPKLTDCPTCATPTLRKQLTAAAFKLKGTGWYETDFKNSGKKPEAKTEKKKASSDTTNSDSSTSAAKSTAASSTSEASSGSS